MNRNKLLNQAEAFIHSFYVNAADPRLHFHTYSRVKEAVKTAEKISKHVQPDEASFFTVCVAAWFHDSGYLTGQFDSFREKSVELAQEFLKSEGVSEEDIIEVKKCILATANAEPPLSLPAKILCDALTYYFGTDKFKSNQKLLKKEIEAVKNTTISRNEWRKEKIRTLETHQYYTDYCKLLLDKTKGEHLERLKKKQTQELFVDPPAAVNVNNGPSKPVFHYDPVETKKVPPPEKKPIRGVDTMFRISSSNSQKISMMADNKAHIMISVNSIIISVVLGLMIGKLDENRYLLLPTIILLSINVATIIYSVLATRPKLSEGVFTPEEVENRSVNLLFYGNFYKMPYTDYETAMRKVMNDREFLYGSLIKDIYWQGKVLARKYRLLRISYNIFMYGIAVAVIAYTIAAFFAKS